MYMLYPMNILRTTSRVITAACLLSGLAFVSCSTEDQPEALTPVAVQDDGFCYAVNLRASLTGYADEPATRAALSLPQQAVVHVRLSKGSAAAITGTLTQVDGQWYLTPSTTLENGEYTCQCYYFEGKSTLTGTVALDADTPVYVDASGSCSVSATSIEIDATHLQPLLTRIRFKGAVGTQFQVSGLTLPASYDVSTGQFSYESKAVARSITSSSYSDYIYFSDFANPSARQLSVTNAGSTYTLSISQEALPQATSGWLNVPTSSSHTGWTKEGGDEPDTPENGSHAYVDLGLSVKWATCNVGAGNPEDYGDYYAWGETETKSDYSWSTYKWCNGSSETMTKYCTYSDYGTVDYKTQLDLSDDVAHVKWGGNWRMPTNDEFTELRNTSNCTWTWTTQGGKNGYKVTSKKNGNSIFLPAAGCRLDGSLLNAGSYGDYWSSSLSTSSSDRAYYVLFDSSDVLRNYGGRYYGRSVRPVCP